MTIPNFTSGQALDSLALNNLVAELNSLSNDMPKAKKGVRQVVQNFLSGVYLYGGTTSRSGATVISALTTSITVEEDNSDIEYNVNMSYELDHDNVFFLERQINGGSWVEIGSADAASNRYGFFVSAYDQDVNSTPELASKSFLDSPNASVGDVVTYRLRYYGQNSYQLSINRTANSTGSANYERGSTSVILKEIVK